MKCEHCGGRLEDRLSACPFCGTRQDIDLRQVHYRDLGHEGSLPCPDCESTLGVLEFDTDPAIRIERCERCYGMLFNPGELEALLVAKTNPVVWLDRRRIEELKRNYGWDHMVVYRKCPICRDRMVHRNFGVESGVILDVCRDHGVWLEGGELRQLIEWWRAGGKLIHQQHEQAKVARGAGRGSPRGSVSPARGDGGVDWGRLEDEVAGDRNWVGWTIFGVVLGLLAILAD